MKKLLSILWITISVCFAQNAEDSCTCDLAPGVTNVPIAEWDDNLFYCNWITDQTFCYGQPAPDTAGGLAIKLLADGEEFAIPKYGTLWSVYKERHRALDIDLKTGEPVVAMFDGIVRYAQYNKGGFGNLVIVRHYNGLETYYAHFSMIKVKPNQKVKAGEVLGFGGNTGRSYNPHLHLEVRFMDNQLDPLSFIDWTNKCLKTNELVLNQKVFQPWTLGIFNEVPETRIDKPKKLPEIPGAVYHIIKKGETLYSISQKYQTTVKEICTLNKISNPDIVLIDQKIRVK